MRASTFQLDSLTYRRLPDASAATRWKAGSRSSPMRSCQTSWYGPARADGSMVRHSGRIAPLSHRQIKAGLSSGQSGSDARSGSGRRSPWAATMASARSQIDPTGSVAAVFGSTMSARRTSSGRSSTAARTVRSTTDRK